MEQQIRSIISDIYYDLKEAIESYGGGELDAESLADSVGDRLHDDCPEYRTMSYDEGRAIVLKICKEYV